MKITRLNLESIRDQLEAVLKAADWTQLGVDVSVGRCRFNQNAATFKVEVKTVDEDGEAFDEDAANFKVFAEEFGLKEEYFGKTFTSQDVEYTISGLKLRNRKYPVLAIRADGKRFKFPARLVKRLLEV
jgi:hypothetical protein